MILNMLGVLFSLSVFKYSYSPFVETQVDDREITISTNSEYNINRIYSSTYSNLNITPVVNEDLIQLRTSFQAFDNGWNANVDFGSITLSYHSIENEADTYNVELYYTVDNTELEQFQNNNIIPYFKVTYRFSNNFSDSFEFFNTQYSGEGSYNELYLSGSNFTSIGNVTLVSVYFDIGYMYISTPSFPTDVDEAYNSGYNAGKSDGYNLGSKDGENIGYQKGFYEAKNIYENQSANINSIFTGILDVGMLPLNFFLTIFNFEIFGINIAGIVGGVLTIFLLVMMIRLVLGGKDGD